MRTDPALAARRRPLKPLLAEVLTGEPWLAALQTPQGLDPAVQAACVISYISRRHPTWETLPAAELNESLSRRIVADRAAYCPGDWPFLDALESLLPVIAWTDIGPLLEPYRNAIRRQSRTGVATFL